MRRIKNICILEFVWLKEGETVADILQRKVAKYGDFSGKALNV